MDKPKYDHIDALMFTTLDRKYRARIDGNYLTALHSMLTRVCSNNPYRMEEATRLLRLFMEKAYEQGKLDGKTEQSGT